MSVPRSYKTSLTNQEHLSNFPIWNPVTDRKKHVSQFHNKVVIVKSHDRQLVLETWRRIDFLFRGEWRVTLRKPYRSVASWNFGKLWSQITIYGYSYLYIKAVDRAGNDRLPISWIRTPPKMGPNGIINKKIIFNIGS